MYCTYLFLFTFFMTPSPLPAQQQTVSTLVFLNVSIHFMYKFVFLYILHDTFFITTFTTTESKYVLLFLCMCPSTLCTHLSLFMSSMTPFSPLPALQQNVSIYSCFYACVHSLYVHICLLFTSSMTPSSPFFSLYILHDTFFTTTCTTTDCKYSCFCACVHPLCVHICLSLLPP